MPIVNCITDLWFLYNVHESLTVIVSNFYLFCVSFAGLEYYVNNHYSTIYCNKIC